MGSGCKQIQSYANQCLGRLTFQKQVFSLSGKEYLVNTRPDADTVQQFMIRLREQFADIQIRDFKLLIDGNVMRGRDLMSKYDLAGMITYVVGCAIGECLLHMPLDNPDKLGFDEISGEMFTTAHEEDVKPVEENGRRGAMFTGNGKLIPTLDIHIPERAWSVSLWAVGPLHSAGGFKVLLDGMTQESLILVLWHHGRIGSYCGRGNWVPGFNFETVLKPSADNWHHIAAVRLSGEEAFEEEDEERAALAGRKHRVLYYIDGEKVGEIAMNSVSGRIGCIGNSFTETMGESIGLIADLRIFGEAASPGQIRSLYESSCAVPASLP